MVHTRDLRHEPWRYRLRAFVSKPANLLLVFFLIVLVVLSLLPMATMLSNMFTVHVGTEKKLLRLPVDSTTLWHFQKLFAGDEWSQVNFWQPLWNSLIVALGSGILGIAVGGTVAWFITRSDLKCKKFISAVFVFPYMMPAWTLALFWTNMFQNSQVGGGNIGMVESIFGVCMPEWFVYGLFPMIVVTGLHYSPFAYLLIGGILKNMDATLEESATILKANRATIIRRVTIPIVMPAILSTFLLIFSSGFSSYTVPVFLGSAVKCYTLSTKMRALIQAGYQGQRYIIAFVSILLGCLILGFGVYLEMAANVAMLPGESFVRAVSTTWHRDFGLTKIVFDVSMSLTAAGLSLVLAHTLDGVREGTLIAALLVGLVARTCRRVQHRLQHQGAGQPA